MRRRIILLVASVILLAACAKTQPAPYGAPARACDDGGAGGVIIDGVCL